MTPVELQELAEKIKALPPPDKLRLAAGLLEQRRPDIALTIIQGVANELGAVLALKMVQPKGGRR